MPEAELSATLGERFGGDRLIVAQPKARAFLALEKADCGVLNMAGAATMAMLAANEVDMRLSGEYRATGRPADLICAVVLSLLLRVAALASLPNGHLVVWALIAAHAAARATMPALMFLLPPARSDGLSFDAGQPPSDGTAAAAVLGFVILAFCLHPGGAIVALIFLFIVVALMAWLARRQIDGQTGDVLGALEQVSEITILLVALG
jgi:hypothetical protein